MHTPPSHEPQYL
ncbi:hypothetical protein AYX14_07176 [Cryptococcus neoformans]|nr:hypothetical protein AYX14_07176 [Cryptococcus neoformans var. grubii]